jgi:hypothetical protein
MIMNSSGPLTKSTVLGRTSDNLVVSHGLIARQLPTSRDVSTEAEEYYCQKQLPGNELLRQRRPSVRQYSYLSNVNVSECYNPL